MSLSKKFFQCDHVDTHSFTFFFSFLANKAANRIINQTLFDEIVFEEEEEEEIIEVRNFGNLNQLYNQIRPIYEAEF